MAASFNTNLALHHNMKKVKETLPIHKFQIDDALCKADTFIFNFKFALISGI